MLRRYHTHPGEQKQVGSNLGLPGNYALYLVASGIAGLLLWTLFGLFTGDSGQGRMIAVWIALLPPISCAGVIFGLLLGKPPHYAADCWASIGRNSFRVSGTPTMGTNPLTFILYRREKS